MGRCIMGLIIIILYYCLRMVVLILFLSICIVCIVLLSIKYEVDVVVLSAFTIAQISASIPRTQQHADDIMYNGIHARSCRPRTTHAILIPPIIVHANLTRISLVTHAPRHFLPGNISRTPARNIYAPSLCTQRHMHSCTH